MFASSLRRVGVAFAALVAATTLAVEPPGLALKTTVDLSPGADVFAPSKFALNRATHRLYVFAEQTSGGQNFGLKLLDSRSGAVLGGVDLGRYSAYPFENYTFQPRALVVDETAAPLGDKVYVLGSPGGGVSFYLRVIEGATGDNLTAEGTDLPLPLDSFDSRAGIALHPASHKIYLVDQYGKVVVVDGPNRKVLTSLQTEAGRGSVLVSNPVANKVLVFGQSGGAVIDCTNDTFKSFEFPELNLEAVAFHSANGRIYLTGTNMTDGASALLVVDGATGATLLSKTDGVVPNASGIAIDPAADLVFVAAGTYGSPGSITAYRGTDLSPAGTFNVSATNLALDPVDGGRLLFLDRTGGAPEVGTLNLATGATERVTVGYKPFRLAVNGTTARVYITDRVAPELLVLHAGTHQVIERRRIGRMLYERGLAVSEARNRVYVTRDEEDRSTGLTSIYVDVLDGATNQTVDSILTSSGVIPNNAYVAIDDVRERIYVTALEYNQTDFSYAYYLRVYHSGTHAPLATIALPGGVTGLAVNPSTGRVYVAGNTPERPDVVTIINGETDTVITTLSAGIGAGPMAINRATNKIYVANALRNTVTVIDGATDSHDPTLNNTYENNGNVASAVAVDEATNRVFIADSSDGFEPVGRVNVFDASNSNEYLGQIELGVYPAGIVFDHASRQIFVTNDQDGTVSVLQAAGSPPANLVNISTRMHVGQGEDVLIAGFIVTGAEGSSKRVAVRGIGPSLNASGVSGALQDTYLELYDAAGGFPLVHNNDWAEDSFEAAELQSLGLAPSDPREAGFVRYLAPGPYTVLLAGAGYGTPNGSASGVALVEVYALDRFSPVQVVNISTRGRVQSGESVMIGGLILQGDAPTRILVRAIGPSLTSSGVAGALQDPTLELYNGNGELVQANDNWRDSQESEITGTTLQPGDNKEAAISATLIPGNYTAIVRGKGDTTGVALVEAYNLR